MKALLKDRKTWVDIDTAYLFNNQYNTADGKRIFDKDVAAIRDDARRGMGKCRYCGALVKRGEEEKHFAEREAKPCDGCFWQRERVTHKDVETTEKTETGADGKIQRVKVRTITERVEKVCAYCDNDCGRKTNCTLRECRVYGINWFTPENTFFLKYPDGFESIPEVDKLEARGFVLTDGARNCWYHKKLGSYTLEARLEYEDGKPIGIKAYRIFNTRRDYVFRYKDGELFTDKYFDGWRQVKTLEGIPADVMKAVRNICDH